MGQAYRPKEGELAKEGLRKAPEPIRALVQQLVQLAKPEDEKGLSGRKGL